MSQRSSLPAVKICGLSTPETVAVAIAAGASHVGFVHYARSPRHVTLTRAAELAMPARGKVAIVLLCVDQDDAFFDEAVRILRPDLLQLHGSETPERAAAVKRRTGVPVMKVIKVETSADVAIADRYRPVCDLIMFDAKEPRDRPGTLPGGNGLPFDWTLLEGQAAKGPFMLSGGLTPGTVAEAIRRTGARLVDVSSGVETAPGRKDPHLIRQFIAAAHAVAAGGA